MITRRDLVAAAIYSSIWCQWQEREPIEMPLVGAFFVLVCYLTQRFPFRPRREAA